MQMFATDVSLQPHFVLIISGVAKLVATYA